MLTHCGRADNTNAAAAVTIAVESRDAVKRGSSWQGRRPSRRRALLPGGGAALVDMRATCAHADGMSKMVQIRNVPDALHRKLKVRAAASGQTLSDYLLTEMARLAARPTREEILDRIHGRKRVTLKGSAAAAIREERDSA